MNKCVLVMGTESSGSKLIAKICSHVLEIQMFGDWNGNAWSDNGINKVYHRSLPYNNPPQYPNIDELLFDNRENYQIYFILTTRDNTISELSRSNKYAKPREQSRLESHKAREIMTNILRSNHRSFIWSYETFMFLQLEYLKKLYQFLEIESNFIPELIDGNISKIAYK